MNNELQRYGRNKDTVINHAYIEGGEYRRKFDRLSDDKNLNRLIYQKAKEMLKHRSGTLFEDMYWIDIDTTEVVASETTQEKEQRIIYSKNTKSIITQNNNLLTLHTHPNSMPPSVSDFNSAFSNNYRICIVCCHDGKIFIYQSNRKISKILHSFTIAKYKKMGYNEYESQLLSLCDFQNNGDIVFKEV